MIFSGELLFFLPTPMNWAIEFMDPACLLESVLLLDACLLRGRRFLLLNSSTLPPDWYSEFLLLLSFKLDSESRRAWPGRFKVFLSSSFLPKLGLFLFDTTPSGLTICRVGGRGALSLIFFSGMRDSPRPVGVSSSDSLTFLIVVDFELFPISDWFYASIFLMISVRISSY